MATINATIKSISVLASEYGNAIYVGIDQDINVMSRTNGVYATATAKEFSINKSKFTAQLCEINDDIALFRSCQTEGLTQKQLALILIGAKVTINVEEFHVGDTYTDKDGAQKAHDHDGYDYDIVSIELTAKATARIDKYCEL